MNPDDLREAFRQRMPMLAKFGEWVTNRVIAQVKEALSASYSETFFKVQPKHRVKDMEGFIEKASREGKGYKDPLKEITDQVGCRFVVLLHNQCDIVNKAIREIQEWDCTSAKDIEVMRTDNPHHFDYESYHWTVRLICSQNIEGFVITPDVTCEIQVRTLLQHAYAELAHSTVYKPQTSAKPQVKRIIARGAALIETTDGVFLRVVEEIEKVTGKIDELLRRCAEWYSEHLTQGSYPASPSALRIADAYVEELSGIEWARIEDFLKKRSWLAEAIKEKRDLPLFNDPVIVLVFWLVHEFEAQMPARWPLDLKLLQPVFTRLSISPGDSLF